MLKGPAHGVVVGNCGTLAMGLAPCWTRDIDQPRHDIVDQPRHDIVDQVATVPIVSVPA